MELRIIVESETASIAARRRTEIDIQRLKECLKLMDEAVSKGTDGTLADLEFHTHLSQMTRNTYLIEFIQFLNGRLKGIIKLSREQANIIQGLSAKVENEHTAIFNAVSDGNSTEARNAMITHLANTSKGLGLNLDLPGFVER